MVTTLSANPALLPEDKYILGHILRSGSGPKREGGFGVWRTHVEDIEPERALTWGGAEGTILRVNLRPLPTSEISQKGRVIALPPRGVMETSFRNVRDLCIWPMAHPVDQITFDLPQAAVALWAEDNAIGRGFIPESMSGTSVADQCLVAFALALAPHLIDAVSPTQFFVDHMLDGVCAYILSTFANGRSLTRGGLAPWQERRAKEAMEASIAADLSLHDLAMACGLSVAHFSRAFRQSCGTTPHRWLMSRRVEKARSLLRTTDLPLTLIAVECGFGDQAHLTRVISRHLGTPPGALRRYWNNHPDGTGEER